MPTLQDLEKHIASLSTIQDAGVPSVSMALLDESNQPSTHVITAGSENPSTLFQACSISKAITALAVAKLVTSNRLSYSDKITAHLPPSLLSSLGLPPATTESVTISSLLSHRSGLSQHGFPGHFGDSPPPTAEDVFLGRPPANTPRIKFDSPPLAQLSYSGGGYLLLQILLEHVLEKSFAGLMREIVLEPLGMTRSRFDELPAEEGNYAKAFRTAWVVGTGDRRGYHDLSPVAAAAGLWTTPRDLLRAVAAIQRSLEGEGGFLSPAVAREMLTRVDPGEEELGMGLGWCVDGLVFGHSGDNEPGYTAYVFGFHGGVVEAEAGRGSAAGGNKGGFAIMVNSALGLRTMKKIIGAVFYMWDWALGDRLPAMMPMRDFVPYEAPHGTGFGTEWRRWVGRWKGGWELLDRDGVPSVRFEGYPDLLRLSPAAFPSRTLDGKHEQTFIVDEFEMAIRLVEEADVIRLQVVQTAVVSVLDKVDL